VGSLSAEVKKSPAPGRAPRTTRPPAGCTRPRSSAP